MPLTDTYSIDKTFEKLSYIIDLQNSIHESKAKKQNELIYKKALEDLKKEENTKKFSKLL